MKRLGVVGLVLALVFAIGSMGWAAMGEGFGPWSGTMGDTMMGRGWWGPGGTSGWHTMGFSVSGLTLTKEQAAQIARAHLQALGNPNLGLGELIDFEPYFETTILTKDGTLVEKLLVDKRSGWLRSVY